VGGIRALDDDSTIADRVGGHVEPRHSGSLVTRTTVAGVTGDALSARTVDDVRLAVSVHGSGPTLVMIPGLGSSRRVYDPLVPHLARHLCVVVFDPRGIGESDFVEGPYTMSQLAADTVAVIDALGEPAASVWGASMGGMVAQHVAIEHGERVQRLLLACTGPGGPHTVPAHPAATRALLGKGASTPAEAYRLACTVMYSPEFQRRHAAFIEDEVRHRGLHPVRARVFNAQYEAARQHDTYERLPSITAPTLVLHGTDDLVVPVQNGELIASRVPGAQWQPFPRGSHLFFHETPEAVAAAVLAFLD
jgi:3-oxoadipate enol-lactonase